MVTSTAPESQWPWPRVKVTTPGRMVSVTWTVPIIGFLAPLPRSQTPSGLVADTTLTLSPVCTPSFLASLVWRMMPFSGMRSVR